MDAPEQHEPIGPTETPEPSGRFTEQQKAEVQKAMEAAFTGLSPDIKALGVEMAQGANAWVDLGAIRPPQKDQVLSFRGTMESWIKTMDYLPDGRASTSGINPDALKALGESYARLLGFANTEEWKKSLEENKSDSQSSNNQPPEPGIYQPSDVPSPFNPTQK